jgi:hypothetical protein
MLAFVSSKVTVAVLRFVSVLTSLTPSIRCRIKLTLYAVPDHVQPGTSSSTILVVSVTGPVAQANNRLHDNAKRVLNPLISASSMDWTGSVNFWLENSQSHCAHHNRATGTSLSNAKQLRHLPAKQNCIEISTTMAYPIHSVTQFAPFSIETTERCDAGLLVCGLISLKSIPIHEISPSWNEQTSTGDS